MLLLVDAYNFLIFERVIMTWSWAFGKGKFCFLLEGSSKEKCRVFSCFAFSRRIVRWSDCVVDFWAVCEKKSWLIQNTLWCIARSSTNILCCKVNKIIAFEKQVKFLPYKFSGESWKQKGVSAYSGTVSEHDPQVLQPHHLHKNSSTFPIQTSKCSSHNLRGRLLHTRPTSVTTTSFG